MKGILFRPDMIKAIVEGRKTQTRRLDGLKEINQEPDSWELSGFNKGGLPDFGVFHFWSINNKELPVVTAKPRYRVGEVVYIKEAWAVNPTYDDLKPSEIPSPAFVTYLNDRHNVVLVGRNRSPLFMPEWAARHFIQITGVRSERLNQITEEDAIAEGILPEESPFDAPPAMRYATLWDSLNPKVKWETNPFVWVYSFKKVERG